MITTKGLRALLSILIVAGSAVAAWLVIPMPGRADAPKRNCAGDPAASDLRSGEGTIAISNREIVVIGSRSRGCLYQRKALGVGLLRHVAVTSGSGSAYVEDQAGGDVLVVYGPSGVRRIASSNEITHPALSDDGALLWAENMRSLRLSRGTSTSMIARPPGTTAVFSPTFVGRLIAAVAQEPLVGRTMTEDDMLNNLYLRTGKGWRRLTNFHSDGDAWSAIRTPVVTAGGEILFVRVRGYASRTVEPRFELWGASKGRATKLRDLPGEMYLAGLRGGRLMWNVYSGTCGDWELLVEDRGSGLRHLGCGAVLVDPVNVADPDLEVEDVHRSASTPEVDRDIEPGVVIGDFSTRQRAEDVADLVPGSRVIDHDQAPAAVRPGAYAVAIEAGNDPSATLRRIRRLVPNHRQMVFLAPLGKLGV